MTASACYPPKSGWIGYIWGTKPAVVGSIRLTRPHQMKHPITSILLNLAILVLAAPAVSLAAQPQTAAATSAPVRANLGSQRVSPDVRHIADWAVHSRDNKDLPFIIVDKVNAQAVAFDARGRLLREAPVLLGMGVGDRYAPGVAEMDMYDLKPWQRITPAGRYFADEGRDLDGNVVLWVHYDSGVAIHKVPTKFTKQRRQERIRSATPADNRITYGCINVPASFYDHVVARHFRSKGGIVYVLPDSTPLKTIFRSYDIDQPAALRTVQTSPRRSPAVPARRF